MFFQGSSTSLKERYYAYGLLFSLATYKLPLWQLLLIHDPMLESQSLNWKLIDPMNSACQALEPLNWPRLGWLAPLSRGWANVIWLSSQPQRIHDFQESIISPLPFHDPLKPKKEKSAFGNPQFIIASQNVFRHQETLSTNSPCHETSRLQSVVGSKSLPWKELVRDFFYVLVFLILGVFLDTVRGVSNCRRGI